MAEEFKKNGWSEYQRLVLSELERHELQHIQTGKDIMEIKLELQRLRSDIQGLDGHVKKLMAMVEESEKKNHNLHLNLDKLNWKSGAIITGFSSAISIAVTLAAKLFLH